MKRIYIVGVIQVGEGEWQPFQAFVLADEVDVIEGTVLRVEETLLAVA